MKNYKLLSKVIILVVLSIPIFTIPSVYATVGGETLIYDFKYNPSDESVYYTRIDGSGRGCPPELRKISLNSEKSTIVFSCDQGEKISPDQVNSEINTITSGFKPLTPLSLKSNIISVDVKFIKTETYGPESSEVLLRHFIVSIYQNGEKVKEFPITGCSLNQPFTFQGYSIPGFNKKILLLISAKNNCNEGGYIHETLQVIGGVDNLDKTFIGNFYKRPSPLLPNEGNLVIYESDTLSVTNEPIKITTPTSTPTTESANTVESFFIRFLNWLKSLF